MPPTGHLAHNTGMCPDWERNQQPPGSQAGAQPTEPHQPGQVCIFLVKLLLVTSWPEPVVHIVITYTAFLKSPPIKFLIQGTWKGIQNQWLMAIICRFQEPGLWSLFTKHHVLRTIRRTPPKKIWEENGGGVHLIV